MKTILFSLFLAANIITANGQKTAPIADETEMAITDKAVKVKCSNEQITAMLLKQFKSFIIRYNVSYKKDRMGRYAEYTIFLSKEVEFEVSAFLKSL